MFTPDKQEHIAQQGSFWTAEMAVNGVRKALNMTLSQGKSGPSKQEAVEISAL